MPDWTAFGAVAGLVLFLVLALARATTGAATRSGASAAERSHTDAGAESDVAAADARTAADATTAAEASRAAEASTTGEASATASSAAGARPADEHRFDESPGVSEPPVEQPPSPAIPSVSTAALLVNVVVTHGVFAAVLLGAAGLTGVPAEVLGVADAAWSTGGPAVVGGLALGTALAGANALLAANLGRFGIEHSEALREALAPEAPLGWATLLLLILPIVAIFEELLFRAVLVGGAAAATGASPWLFVVLSSIAFALGHGIQGRGGLLVTGLLGGVLAVAFVVTNSLLLVVLAHYVVNAVEFVLKEWLDVDLRSRLAV